MGDTDEQWTMRLYMLPMGRIKGASLVYSQWYNQGRVCCAVQLVLRMLFGLM